MQRVTRNSNCCRVVPFLRPEACCRWCYMCIADLSLNPTRSKATGVVRRRATGRGHTTYKAGFRQVQAAEVADRTCSCPSSPKTVCRPGRYSTRAFPGCKKLYRRVRGLGLVRRRVGHFRRATAAMCDPRRSKTIGRGREFSAAGAYTTQRASTLSAVQMELRTHTVKDPMQVARIDADEPPLFSDA